MIRAIWAQTRDRVIGRDAAVVMGRLTYESIGKPLPRRINVMVSRDYTLPCKAFGGCLGYPAHWADGTRLTSVRSIEKALEFAAGFPPIEAEALRGNPSSRCDIWFIGGARIYEAAMPYVDEIDVTVVPDEVPVEGSVLAPVIDESVFRAEVAVRHEDSLSQNEVLPVEILR